jgi:hypothetical protein
VRVGFVLAIESTFLIERINPHLRRSMDDLAIAKHDPDVWAAIVV